MVLQEKPAAQAQPVQPALQDKQVLKEQLEQLDLPVHKEHKVIQDLPVPQVIPGKLGPPVKLVAQAILATPVIQGKQVLLVIPATPALLDKQVIQVQLVKPVIQGQRAQPAQQAQQAKLALPAKQVQQAQQAQQV
jgi:hypothetical protein